jgi:hypothetical protein
MIYYRLASNDARRITVRAVLRSGQQAAGRSSSQRSADRVIDRGRSRAGADAVDQHRARN